MAMAGEVQSTGTVLRGADGSIYFIRNEVLEACKQPPDMAKQLEQLMQAEQEVQGFSIDTSNDLQALGEMRGPMEPLGALPKSTIMCPSLWVTR
jgi:hypothetical protein